jgi:hypothetical protein
LSAEGHSIESMLRLAWPPEAPDVVAPSRLRAIASTRRSKESQSISWVLSSGGAAPASGGGCCVGPATPHRPGCSSTRPRRLGLHVLDRRQLLDPSYTAGPKERRFRILPARGNLKPACAAFDWDEESASFQPYGIMVLRMDRLVEHHRLSGTWRVPAFRLPSQLR